MNPTVVNFNGSNYNTLNRGSYNTTNNNSRFGHTSEERLPWNHGGHGLLFSDDEHTDLSSPQSATSSHTSRSSILAGAINGNVYVHNDTTTENAAFKLLQEAASIDALHNSAERSPHPEIYPNTRVPILSRIREWSRSSDLQHQSNMFFVHGPVGVGKSAIAQAIANEFHDQKQLAASFFFWRNDTGRNTILDFIHTIAYQLVRSDIIPTCVRDQILRAVAGDALRRDFDSQFQELIVKPCALADWTDLPRLVVVDGVDECGEPQDRDKGSQRLVGLLWDAVCAGKIPFRILLTTRSKRDLPKAQAQVLRVEDLGDPKKKKQHWLDIETFFRGRFQDILQERRGEIEGDSWPAEKDVRELIQRACGQFIYAQTIIRYIDSDNGRTPQENLEVVLKAATDPKSASRYSSSMDILYQRILAGFLRDTDDAEVEAQRRLILSLILTPPLFREKAKVLGSHGERMTEFRRQNIFTHRTPWLIGQYLGVRPEVVRARLGCALESVLVVPAPKRVGAAGYPNHVSIRVRHTSFVEFLLERSGEDGVRRLKDEEVHDMLARALIRRLVVLCEECNTCEDAVLPVEKPEVKYTMEEQFDAHALNYWGLHCCQSGFGEELAATLDLFDPWAYVGTALKMGRMHPYYNPNRYLERWELVWERFRILHGAFEWASTNKHSFRVPPSKFISKCHDLFHGGFRLVPCKPGEVGMDSLIVTKAMLDLFRLTATVRDEHRKAVWGRWVERLAPEFQERPEERMLASGVKVLANADKDTRWIDESRIREVLAGQYEEYLVDIGNWMKELETQVRSDAPPPPPHDPENLEEPTSQLSLSDSTVPPSDAQLVITKDRTRKRPLSRTTSLAEAGCNVQRLSKRVKST
ncbi:hypothetical protein VNI00_012903 [Paramarasmius palmivorus]|uniref:Nephrocystin 3-like N-terminal domain-containing protein n=1 Tax=Paramarasmius palmivorus TaxID=297713 RepID=A0AAW0C0M4_9AGAR